MCLLHVDSGSLLFSPLLQQNLSSTLGGNDSYNRAETSMLFVPYHCIPWLKLCDSSPLLQHHVLSTLSGYDSFH